MGERRPTGVIVLGILILLWSIASTLAAGMLLKVFLTPDSQISMRIFEGLNMEAIHGPFWTRSMSDLGIAFVYLLLSILPLVASIGLIMYRDWGRVLLLLFVALDVGGRIADHFIVQEHVLSEWPFLILDAFIVLYLFLPKIRKHFK